MANFHLLALTNCVAGQDEEFNRWYDERHLPDVLAVPGIISAQRFKLCTGFEGQLAWRYLTLYELNTEDPNAILQELGSRMGTAVMPATVALEMTTAGAVGLQAVGERVCAPQK